MKLCKMGWSVDMEPSKNAILTQHSSANQLKSLWSSSEMQQQKSQLINCLMSTGLDLVIGTAWNECSMTWNNMEKCRMNVE